MRRKLLEPRPDLLEWQGLVFFLHLAEVLWYLDRRLLACGRVCAVRSDRARIRFHGAIFLVERDGSIRRSAMSSGRASVPIREEASCLICGSVPDNRGKDDDEEDWEDKESKD